jgi:hypothetical protein
MGMGISLKRIMDRIRGSKGIKRNSIMGTRISSSRIIMRSMDRLMGMIRGVGEVEKEERVRIETSEHAIDGTKRKYIMEMTDDKIAVVQY